MALYFATILSFKVRFANLFKGILFFPSLMNGVAIAFIFLYFFREGGTLDSVLDLVGLGALKHQWLGDPSLINYSLSGVSVWRYMGLNFVLFLGAIQSIPAQLYEAADIDGATRWQQFRYIIAPGIRPIIGLTFILAIAGSLAVFEIPFIMTGGANGSETFVIQTVKQSFENQHVGLASAMAVVLLAIILVVTGDPTARCSPTRGRRCHDRPQRPVGVDLRRRRRPSYDGVGQARARAHLDLCLAGDRLPRHPAAAGGDLPRVVEDQRRAAQHQPARPAARTGPTSPTTARLSTRAR